MLKMLGCCLVLFACVRVGILLKGSLKKREKELTAFLCALQSLETEISYGVTPLPAALQTAGKAAGGTIGKFFWQTGKSLQETKGKTSAEIWQEQLSQFQDELTLQLDDLELIRKFGIGLGTSDVKDQIKRIQLLAVQVRQRIDAAAEKWDKMGKVYLGLSWGVGMVVVLLWI